MQILSSPRSDEVDAQLKEQMLQFMAADGKLSCDSVDGIELAGEALNKNAVVVMPKKPVRVGTTQ
jgi:tellurite resistance protein